MYHILSFGWTCQNTFTKYGSTDFVKFNWCHHIKMKQNSAFDFNIFEEKHPLTLIEEISAMWLSALCLLVSYVSALPFILLWFEPYLTLEWINQLWFLINIRCKIWFMFFHAVPKTNKNNQTNTLISKNKIKITIKKHRRWYVNLIFSKFISSVKVTKKSHIFSRRFDLISNIFYPVEFAYTISLFRIFSLLYWENF